MMVGQPEEIVCENNIFREEEKILDLKSEVSDLIEVMIGLTEEKREFEKMENGVKEKEFRDDLNHEEINLKLNEIIDEIILKENNLKDKEVPTSNGSIEGESHIDGDNDRNLEKDVKWTLEKLLSQIENSDSSRDVTPETSPISKRKGKKRKEVKKKEQSDIEETVTKMLNVVIDDVVKKEEEAQDECQQIRSIMKHGPCISEKHVGFKDSGPEFIRPYDPSKDYTVDIQFVEKMPKKVVSYRALFLQKKAEEELAAQKENQDR